MKNPYLSAQNSTTAFIPFPSTAQRIRWRELAQAWQEGYEAGWDAALDEIKKSQTHQPVTGQDRWPDAKDDLTNARAEGL